MWTIEYKGSYIHGYFDDKNVQVSFVYGPTIAHRIIPCREYKSLHSAKVAITRFNKDHNK